MKKQANVNVMKKILLCITNIYHFHISSSIEHTEKNIRNDIEEKKREKPIPFVERPINSVVTDGELPNS